MKKKSSFLLKAIGAVSAGTIGAGYLLFNEIMNRDAVIVNKVSDLMSKKAPDSTADQRKIWFDSQTFENYELINDRGHKLKGYFLPAETSSNVFVFLSHGYRSGGLGEFELMTKFYHDKGYNILIVDHQAHGESEGKYIGFGYHEHFDSLKWLDFLIDKFGKDIQIILHGISMGCATVTMMSGSDSLPENVKFTVADCGYTSAYDEFSHNAKSFHMPARPVLDIANFFNKKISGYDFKDANPLKSVESAKVPMLFIHGGKDDFVPTEMVYKLYDACNSEHKDLLIVDGAEHAQSYITDSESYEAKINEFAEKFIR